MSTFCEKQILWALTANSNLQELVKFLEKKDYARFKDLSLNFKTFVSRSQVFHGPSFEIHADFRRFKVGEVADPSTVTFSQIGGCFLLARNADRI